MSRRGLWYKGAMLTRTFVHLPGIGPVREKSLWRRGFHHWNDLDREADALFRDKAGPVRETLRQSAERLERADYHFFYETLPRPELWRLAPFCLDDIAYLDIETTGQYAPPQCHTTTIAVYFRGTLHQAHEPAKKREILEYVEREARAYGTFFGEVFDIPFLRQEFGLPFRKAHFDLCFWLKRHGYRGGLKRVEKCFPQIPTRAAMDIDGWDAVRLWRLHEKGTPGALETLLTYNAEDTIVLEQLLHAAYNLDVGARPELGLSELTAPPMPKLATSVDAQVYRMLRG